MGAKRPKHFGKQESLERRRSYLRGFPAVNYNGVIIVSWGKNSSFLVLFKSRNDENRGVACDVLIQGRGPGNILKPWFPRTQEKLFVRPSDD